MKILVLASLFALAVTLRAEFLLVPQGTKASYKKQTFNGVENRGNLTLDHCIIELGQTSGDNGGGIFNAGRLTMRHCIIRDNNASLALGGGLFNVGKAMLEHCEIVSNRAEWGGGGIENWSELVLRHCLVSNNVAPYWVGGLENSGKAVVDHCLFVGNHCGWGRAGAIYNCGNLLIRHSTVTGNQGGNPFLVPVTGGIYTEVDASTTIIKCDIYDNTAWAGTWFSPWTPSPTPDVYP